MTGKNYPQDTEIETATFDDVLLMNRRNVIFWLNFYLLMPRSPSVFWNPKLTLTSSIYLSRLSAKR
jgi:hypothetical protein